jgi:peptidyl-dipeptidase Dcp
MKNIKKTMLCLVTFAAISCGESNEKSTMKQQLSEGNPLASNFETPYEVPPFERITPAHLEEAILEGMRLQQLEIEAIATSTEAPTWENTILAMENSGELLSSASTIFYNLNSADTNDEIQALAKDLSPKASAHSDAIYMNEALFQRVKSVWNDGEPSEELDLQQKKVLENTYKRFVRSGANLTKEDQKKLAEINAALSLKSVEFGQNILKDTNDFELYVEDEKELAGLPESLVEAAKKAAEKKDRPDAWLFGLQNSNVMPFLAYSENRALRQKMFTAYKNRGNNDNEFNNSQLAIDMANLRLEKANLLGYETYADFGLENTMAKDKETVMEFLESLWKPALVVAQNELKDIEAMMKREGINDQVQPWDYSYYNEKIRAEKYAIDNQEIAAYFSLENVREGIFIVTEKLFGLQLTQLDDVPVYHEDVTAWEVKEADGSIVGLLYMDMHPRASKRSGAWMTSYRPQTMKDGERVPPVISIVCNFTNPTSSKPSLLTYDEVTTFFHEFGHALHGLLSNVDYKSIAGTSVPRDFVELPSQVMENWATDPAVLAMYAKHYETGEVIPASLIQKLEDAATFGQGFATTEYLASSLLDMDFHTITEPLNVDAPTFEATTLKERGLVDAITARHSSTHFSHIFAGGYSAGYYSYIWSGVLDTDAFDQFKQTELFNAEKALSFRQNILEKGGSEEPMELYKRFRGSEPSVEPLLRKRGLNLESMDKKMD